MYIKRGAPPPLNCFRSIPRAADLSDGSVDDVVELDLHPVARSATSARARPGRTRKPMMMAPESRARSTSDSLMAPTARWDDLDLHLGRPQLLERRPHGLDRAVPSPLR